MPRKLKIQKRDGLATRGFGVRDAPWTHDER